MQQASPDYDAAAMTRTQAERRAEAERKLLDAAMELVAERGVRAVTLAAVGERAGYSRGLVTHHFGSRQGLLDALTRDLQNRFQMPETDQRGLARLLVIVDAYLADIQARALNSRVFLVLWAEALTSEPELREAFASRDARFRATLAECLQEADDLRPDIDPDALAHLLVGLLRGTSLQLLAAGEAGLEPVRAQVRTLLAHGLKADACSTTGHGEGDLHGQGDRHRRAPERPRRD
jgi:AcrR family transcriptional regulator